MSGEWLGVLVVVMNLVRSGAGPPARLPCRLHVAPEAREAVARLWAGSPQFRRQCARLAEAGTPVGIVIDPSIARAHHAETRMLRQGRRVILANVRLGRAVAAEGQIVHELEHVIEGLDGRGFLALPGEVWRTSAGATETARARLAEAQARAELAVPPR